MKLYYIRDWDQIYENNRSRELSKIGWFAMPNKQDGDGYTAMMERKDGAAILGAFVACAQIASRCEPRGTLIRDGGRPHDATTLGRMSRIHPQTIQNMLDFCCQEDVNWFAVKDFQVESSPTCEDSTATCENPAVECGNPADTCGADQQPALAIAAVGCGNPAQKGREGKEGIEGKGKEGGVAARGCRYFVDVWNRVSKPPLPKAMTLSGDREKHIGARAKDNWWVENFEAAITKMNESDFCKGINNRGWVADFDFLLQPGKMARIMEGKYDNRSTKKNGSPRPAEPNQLQETIIVKTL